ncbi:hypothetical protein R0381_000943 [Jeongeupia wiesaeckerbachi]|uniref:hypothetical protein n=1 Tax=Jeongeupia wiesaeckerbachi TaxID=3051218 RepID=UPI003D809531
MARMPYGFAVSWLFAPTVGSADIDFFRRIKDTPFEYDVMQVWREHRDEALLKFVGKAKLNRFEIRTDHHNPRGDRSRKEFADAARYHFEVNKDKYDFVISHSNEIHSHFVALGIKKENKKLPWIAYFGDLFERNPYIAHLPGYPKVKEDIRTERETIKYADVIVVNNEFQRDLMFSGDLKKYLDKVVVVPHAYEMSMYDAAPVKFEKKAPFTLMHLGTLYSVKRRAEPILLAVDRLLTIYPEYKSNFELVFVGGAPCQADLDVHKNMKHADHVHFIGAVGYLESLGLMKYADALVLIDGIFNAADDGIEVNPFFACKLADYMGAKKPIIGITMEKGLSSEILKKSQNLTAGLNVDRIAYVLLRALEGKIHPDYGVYEQFSNEHLISRMSAIISNALKGK